MVTRLKCPKKSNAVLALIQSLMSHFYWVFIFLLLFFGNASSQTPTPFTPVYIWHFNGFYVAAVSPLVGYVVQGNYPNNSIQLGSTFFGFSLDYLIERKTNISSSDKLTCVSPNNANLNPLVPPTDPLDNSTNYGTLLNYLPLQRFEYSNRTLVENPLPGITISHLIFDMRDPVSGTLLQSNFSVTQGGNYSYPYSNNTSHTGGQYVTVQYMYVMGIFILPTFHV